LVGFKAIAKAIRMYIGNAELWTLMRSVSAINESKMGILGRNPKVQMERRVNVEDSGWKVKITRICMIRTSGYL
jgi:hypothetical protein